MTVPAHNQSTGIRDMRLPPGAVLAIDPSLCSSAATSETPVMVPARDQSNGIPNMRPSSGAELAIEPSLRSNTSASETYTGSLHNAAVTPAVGGDAGIAALMSKIKELEGKFHFTYLLITDAAFRNCSPPCYSRLWHHISASAQT